MRATLDGVRLAFRAIARDPLRASLTVLGILIGVAAVVIVTGVGTGVRSGISAQIQSIGSNFVIIFPVARQATGAHAALGQGPRLTEDDGRVVKRESTSIASIAPVLRSAGQIVYGDRNRNTSLIGTTLPYFEVRQWPIEHGASWDERDEQLRAKVVRGGLERGPQPLRHRGSRRPYRAHRALSLPRARRAQEQGRGPLRRGPGRLRGHAHRGLSHARDAHVPGLRGSLDGVGDIGRDHRPRRRSRSTRF